MGVNYFTDNSFVCDILIIETDLKSFLYNFLIKWYVNVLTPLSSI